jgi:hypothetical protein
LTAYFSDQDCQAALIIPRAENPQATKRAVERGGENLATCGFVLARLVLHDRERNR